MWVKICGNTNIEDALHAASSGANALGFVFAPSPRRVTAAQVRQIVPHLPGAIETYGVFVDTPVDEIVRTVLECGLTGVQLHRPARGYAESMGSSLPDRLRRHLLARHVNEVRIISVLAFDDTLQPQLELAAGGADAILVDSWKGGGSGNRFDWAAASAPFQNAKDKVRVIAAGGLSPQNVEEAIQTLSPWGVDVVSGVEAAPGRKDARKVEAFIQAARRFNPVLQ